MTAPDVRTPGWCPADSNTETKDANILGALPAEVNDGAERNSGRVAREAAEDARLALIRRNSTATARIAKYGMGKGGKFPGVNRIEASLGRMPWEFPFAGGARVTPRTILGTLIGHDSETVVTPDSMRAAFDERYRAATDAHERIINIVDFKLDTHARLLEYTIDEAGIDREFLIDRQFLFDAEELAEMLNHSHRKANADYSARLYLALRRLGFPRPHGRNMGAAIARIEAWARANALPEWLRPLNPQGGAI